jgi:hypothetical protein
MRTFSTAPLAAREAKKPIPKGVGEFERRSRMRTSSKPPEGAEKGEKEGPEGG